MTLKTSLRPLLLILLGIALAAAWIHVRAWIVFGDPQAVAFKKAILEAGGFVPVTGPMPWTAEFWAQMRVMVFEPFWARFGSLGAGPVSRQPDLGRLRCGVSADRARVGARDRRLEPRGHPRRAPRRGR